MLVILELFKFLKWKNSSSTHVWKILALSEVVYDFNIFVNFDSCEIMKKVEYMKVLFGLELTKWCVCGQDHYNHDLYVLTILK